jgi:hypothetical protein
MQSEIKVLNDLDEKIHAIGEMMIHRQELIKILNKNQTNQSPELVFPSITIWYIFREKFHKWQERKKEQKHV